MPGIIDHLFNHWGDISGTLLVGGIIAHAANTFPVPENKYGRWFLGTIQYWAGQRAQGLATKQGTTIEQKVVDTILSDGK